MRKIVALFAVVGCFAFSGCAKSQSESCKKLITCSEALSAGTGAAMEASYGPSGACWKSDMAARACTTACDSAMDGLKAVRGFGTNAACN